MIVSALKNPAWQDMSVLLEDPAMSGQEDLPAEERDIALMLRVRSGDEVALRELIDRWKTPLINFFYRSLGSFAQSEDLAQMVFIRLYRAAPKYKPTAKLSTFLFHIARRLLINEYRHRMRKPLEPVNPAELQASESGRTALNLMEIEEAFKAALKGMPENHRSAILLFKQQELSYQEIASIMNTSESAVKTWIFRARQHLKSTLKEIL